MDSLVLDAMFDAAAADEREAMDAFYAEEN
jgi:hypothetical protein